MKVGELLPDFNSVNQDCNNIASSDLIGRPVVIYFYPKDDTPGCIKQACSFRDQFIDFENVGARIIGISSDSPEDHRKFIKKHHLPFELLSDKSGELQKSFGVTKQLFGLIPGRETFVFDSKGILIHKFNSQSRMTKHILEAIAALEKIENI